MMTRLSDQSLAGLPSSVAQPGYDRENIGTGILHLGTGAFFKAHQAVYTDTALALEGGDWGICAASINSDTAKKALAPQGGLYTLKTIDEPAQYRVIGALREVLGGPDDRGKIISRISDPALHIITLTITEKGYCLGADEKLDFDHQGIQVDLSGDGLPGTAIGILVSGLAARRDGAGEPMTIISCDNVSENGSKLCGAVLDFAEQKDMTLAEWIKTNIAFPNTMVDSITPASDTALFASVEQALGVEDKACVHRELFTDWVVESFDGPRPAWEKAGVIFTDDVKPYEKAKLTLVNAPHSAMTYLGLLAGLKSVADVMADTGLNDYFHALSRQELIPSMGPYALMDLAQYSDRIGQRFSNPSIQHQLIQIAADGSAKLPQRLLPALEKNFKAGRSIECICLGLAAWMQFVAEQVEAGTALNDPMRVPLSAVAKSRSGDAHVDVAAFLALKAIFPPWIGQEPQIMDAIVRGYAALDMHGAGPAIAATLKLVRG